jgi:beta-xylosidase
MATSTAATRPIAVRQIMPPPPVLPGYHADPHLAVFGDTYYIYPTTDGSEGWMSTSFSCMSSKDLIHWRNHGVILRLGVDVQWADRRAWAPAIATRNGKYYFYISAAQNIGVAVADTPYGPFTDPLGKPLVPPVAGRARRSTRWSLWTMTTRPTCTGARATATSSN